MSGSASRWVAFAASAAAHIAAGALLLGVLLAAGQPLFAEDSWWHLGMGAAYASNGPWLAEDPFLHGALGAPAPAAWLADLWLFGVHQAAGFTGLRVFHAACVGAILGLAWLLLRRASESPLFASVGTAVFAALSAYRLFQLRPHLFTIAACLAVALLLFDRRRVPSWPRVALAALVFALWANLHGAFLVGLVLVAAAAVGCGTAAALAPACRGLELPRARRLAAAAVLGLAATLANPQVLAPHLLYFRAGVESPELGAVSDEWGSGGLLSIPRLSLASMPDPLDWALQWALVASTLAIALVWLRRARGSRDADASRIDPAVLAVALASLVGSAAALRLSWLAFFPLLLLAGALPGLVFQMRGRLVAAVFTLVLLLAFVGAGSWPRISRGVRPDLYARPYPATKWSAHAVWFMRDAGLEGRLFNDYGSGNFLGYWLAPKLRVFVNGSLNVPKERLSAHAAVLAGRGESEGESLGDLLDRHQIDVFLGSGLPLFSRGRPQIQTTAHLEGHPDWIPVFRNLRSAVYLRRGPRSAGNLRRVASYFAAEGVPFDPESGFRVEAVLRRAPAWAFRYGMAPADLEAVRGAVSSFDPQARRTGSTRLAGMNAALGLYERSIAIDRRLLASAEPPLSAARRLVWSLLRLGRFEEAAEAANRLDELAGPGDAESRALARAAREIVALAGRGEGLEAAARVAAMPVFEPGETAWLLLGYREPEARTH